MSEMDLNIFGKFLGKKALHVWQQSTTKLLDKITIVRESGNESYDYPILNNTSEAFTGFPARDSKIPYNQSDWNKVNIPAVPIIASYKVRSFDQIRTKTDLQNNLIRKAVMELRRKQDDFIITGGPIAGAGLNATTNVVTLPTSKTFDLKGAQKVQEVFDLVDMDDNDRYAVVRPPAITDLRQDQNYVGNFNFDNTIVRDGIVGQASGFKLTYRNRLPNGAGGATERRCFAFHRSRVVVYMNQDFTLEVNKIPDELGVQIVAWCSMGCKIIEPQGVAAFDVQNS